MKFLKHISLCLLCAASVRAETVYYALENVILRGSDQMTGVFSWTYTPGDFENGSGQFLLLSIPRTAHGIDDLNITVDIGSSIEFTLVGNYHDDGVDITLVLSQPLTPTTPSLLVLGAGESKYDIGGNGFYAGDVQSGSIVPTNITVNLAEDSPGRISASWDPPIPGLLQQTSDLVYSNWMNAASGSTNPAAFSVSAPAMFYRLVTP